MIDWNSDPVLKQLWLEFFASLPGRLVILKQKTRALQEGSIDVIGLSELKVLVHNLSGTAETYELHVIARVSSLLDDLISVEGRSLQLFTPFLGFMEEVMEETIQSGKDPIGMLQDSRMREL